MSQMKEAPTHQAVMYTQIRQIFSKNDEIILSHEIKDTSIRNRKGSYMYFKLVFVAFNMSLLSN